LKNLFEAVEWDFWTIIVLLNKELNALSYAKGVLGQKALKSDLAVCRKMHIFARDYDAEKVHNVCCDSYSPVVDGL
jgi:hypothetical protein